MTILLGIFTGFSVALYFVSSTLKDSNDLGNTEAKYYDFADSYVKFDIRQNNISRNRYQFYLSTFREED